MVSVPSKASGPGDVYAVRGCNPSHMNFSRSKAAKSVDKYVAPARVRIAGTPPRLAGGKMPIAKLVEFLKKARTPDDKLLAISALKNRGVEAVMAVPQLIGMLRDPAKKVQTAATDVLVGLCSSNSVLKKMRHIRGLKQALANIAETHKKWEVKSFALKVAIKIFSPAEAADMLILTVTGGEWHVCTDSLYYMRSKPILAAIKAAGYEASIAKIISPLLLHSRSAVRIGAVKTLSKFGKLSKAIEAFLAKRLSTETDGGVRSRIASILGKHNSSAKPSAHVNAVGKALAKVASGDKDWAARASAAQALGQMGHAVARTAIPALLDLIVDGRREMARIKRTCMELYSECDEKTDKYFDAMMKAEQTIRGCMGGGRAVWKELIRLWSHDDELVRYFSSRIWANMFWNSTYRNLPK